MIRLDDKEIEKIDTHCGMSEVDGSEPFTPYKYEHHLLEAQIKKILKKAKPKDISNTFRLALLEEVKE